MDPTAPARRDGPCITLASSSTTPSSLGKPPYPTLSSLGSSSTLVTTASAASSVSPPDLSSAIPSSRCCNPFAEEIINGRTPCAAAAGSAASSEMAWILRGGSLAPKRRRVLAAIPPVSVAKKNFLRVHLSIGEPLNSRWQAQLRLMKRPFDSYVMLRLKADAAPQLRAVVHGAVGDDEFDFANIVNGFERVAIENDYVGALAWLYCADFLVESHHARRHDRRGLNRFHRRKSGLNVQFNFAVQTVPRNRLIRSRYDRNPCLMQRANDC